MASLTLVQPILGPNDEDRVMQFRKLTDIERRIVDRLLAEDFPGREAILKQINQSVVKQLDEDGSLEFDVGMSPIAVSKFRIPVEGATEDVDGIPIHILLHVIDGRIKELEVYKEDSSAVIKMPDPEQLRLFRPQ